MDSVGDVGTRVLGRTLEAADSQSGAFCLTLKRFNLVYIDSQKTKPNVKHQILSYGMARVGAACPRKPSKQRSAEKPMFSSAEMSSMILFSVPVSRSGSG